MICWMRRHKPPTWRQQVAPSASVLSLWGSENAGAILIESRVSIQSHKRSQVTRFITYRSQEWSNKPSAVPSHREQVIREQVGCVHAKSLQSCLTLCDPMDCSPPGSSVHRISQARTLEWVAISSSRASSPPKDQTLISSTGRWILYPGATWEVPSL